MNDFRFTDLTEDEFHRAAIMWRAGKDTLAIASALHRHESVIANLLSDLKSFAHYISAEAAE